MDGVRNSCRDSRVYVYVSHLQVLEDIHLSLKEPTVSIIRGLGDAQSNESTVFAPRVWVSTAGLLDGWSRGRGRHPERTKCEVRDAKSEVAKREIARALE